MTDGALGPHRAPPRLGESSILLPFFGVFDLHDGCGKQGDLVFREVKVFYFGHAFDIDTCLLQHFAFGFE